MQTNNCQFCGSPTAISQRTGKPYCSKLCWKNNQPQQSYQPPQPQSYRPQAEAYVTKAEYDAFTNNLRKAFKSLQDKVHALEMLSVEVDNKKAYEFHKGTRNIVQGDLIQDDDIPIIAVAGDDEINHNSTI